MSLDGRGGERVERGVEGEKGGCSGRAEQRGGVNEEVREGRGRSRVLCDPKSGEEEEESGGMRWRG